MTKDWKVFHGKVGPEWTSSPHDGLLELPPPPPWRLPRPHRPLVRPTAETNPTSEVGRAETFLPTEEMITAVNAALYLRRPLLLTGKPGTGKSTLITKVAHELKLGPVLRWAIGSRSNVRSGIYEYDAVGRLQALQENRGEEAPVESFVTLGPLGTALMADSWPRPLLIDELDKSDLDFANDLLNVIEDGEYDIPELRRLARSEVSIRNHLGGKNLIRGGRIECVQFPFVVMTSNGEREFPAAFLRRCIRLRIREPEKAELSNIIQAHLARYESRRQWLEGSKPVIDQAAIGKLVDTFLNLRAENKDLSTDQLLNAIFVTIAMPAGEERTFDAKEHDRLRENLFRPLSGTDA